MVNNIIEYAGSSTGAEGIEGGLDRYEGTHLPLFVRNLNKIQMITHFMYTYIYNIYSTYVTMFSTILHYMYVYISS